jgi:hypothetical protein
MSTTLPGNLGTLDWSSWTRGLATSFIGGGSGAVSAGFSTMIIDPKDFNAHTWKMYIVMGVSFLFSGVMAMMQFLHNKPIPDLIERERVMKTTGTLPTIAEPNPPAPTYKEVITEKSIVAPEKKEDK